MISHIRSQFEENTLYKNLTSHFCADPDNTEGRDQLGKDVRREKSECDHLLQTLGGCTQPKSASCYRSQVILDLLLKSSHLYTHIYQQHHKYVK